MPSPARAPRPQWPRSVVVLIALGTVARLALLAFSWNDKLDPDAREYLILARRYSFRHPWSASFREPLWRAIDKLAVGPFGYGPHAQRVLTVAISIAVLPVAWLLFRRLARARVVPERVAVVALGVVALSAQTVREAPRGLREDLCMLLFLIFATLLLARSARIKEARLATSLKEASLVAAPVAVLSVIRWELATFAALIAVFFAIARRTTWATPLLAVIGIAVLSGPWLIANQHKHGSLFYNSKVHATYYWKQEQSEAVRARYRSPVAADPPVRLTWAQYYLDYVGPTATAKRVVIGYVKVTTKFVASQVVPRGAAVSTLGTNQRGKKWELALFLVGLIVLGGAAWVVRRLRLASTIPALLWETLGIVALAIPPYAALANFGLEMRVLMFSIPVLALAVGVMVDVILQSERSRSSAKHDAVVAAP